MNETFTRQEEMIHGLLLAVAEDHALTQRKLSERLGIALGVANATMKRCLEQGLIKIQQTPKRRFLYALTPQGFTEKARLTARYVETSLAFYREASRSCERLLLKCQRQGLERVVLYGLSDLAELLLLWARQTGVVVEAIWDAQALEQHQLSVPIVKTMPVESTVLILTQLPQGESVKVLAQLLSDHEVIAPDILGDWRSLL